MTAVLGGVRVSETPLRDLDGDARTPPSIVVVAPVLNRPANAAPLVESFRASEPDAYLLFVCTLDDTEQIKACDALWDPERVDVWVTIREQPAGPGDYAAKIQQGYDQPWFLNSPYVLCGADDLRFHPGWDTALLAIAEEFDVGVVGTNDLANSAVLAQRHSTHPLVARGYIDSMGGYVGGAGKVYCELYDHQMVDSELVATAMQRGCYAHAPNSRIEHLHPLWRTAPSDATYRKGQAKGAQDRALFESRRHLWELERGPA